MNISKIILIFLISTSKFLIGIGMAVASNLSPIESFILVVSGGIFGVLFYLFLLELIVNFIAKKTTNVKIKVNGWRRFMIKLKQKGGLFGIAALTPLILSIPVGIALSISLGSSRRRILLFHIASVLIWSLIIIGAKYLFNFDVTKNIHT